MIEDKKNIIREYIKTELLFDNASNELTDEKPLLGDTIDSIGLQALVPFLETKFGISIPDLELIPDNFVNINTIAGLLDRLSRGE